jgi:lipopolysaccharide transport system permease protein
LLDSVRQGHLDETDEGDDLLGQRTTVIEPRAPWRGPDVRELWGYRELLWVLTARDVKVRYKQTVLGFLWAIIQPVTLMVVFSIFFGGLAKIPSDGIPYPVFVYAALLPWTFFANAVNAASGSVIGSGGLVTKVYFPRLIIPVASVGSGLVDFCISTCILLLLMAWFAVGWSLNLLAVPILLFGVVLAALGVGTFFAALTVAYRDFRHVVSFLLQFWMFATPVVYPASLVPEGWRWLLYLNPMAGFIEGFRSGFLGRPFDLAALAISFAIALVLFLGGVAYFEKVKRRFADVI